MVSILPKPRRSSARPPLFIIFVILACLLISVVHGQTESDPDSDEPSLPSPSPSPSPSPIQPSVISPSTTPAPSTPPPSGTPAPTTLGKPAPGIIAPPPNPIFTTSDACVACQKEFFSIRNCSALIPPSSVNLTTIVQVLPFYSCICQNDSVEIDALQQCSSCFRSTGQHAFLNVQFYNVTNQQVKAMKQVCEETVDGSRVPPSVSSSSRAGAGLRDLVLHQSTGWSFVLVVVSALVLTPGGL